MRNIYDSAHTVLACLGEDPSNGRWLGVANRLMAPWQGAGWTHWERARANDQNWNNWQENDDGATELSAC
jgi:hypothetical protein